MEAMSSQDVRRTQRDPFYGFLLPATAVYEFLAHALVPQWRGLMQSEVNLEHCLQQFPPHFIAEFCLHSSAGRSAQERGDLESATASFLHCKTQLEAAKETVEKQMYKWLLACVDLPLAQLYQMRSSAEISDSDRRAELLEEALEIREEILDCVMPLQNSHSHVVGVCLSYCLTAQYEWGSLTADSDAQNDAKYKYAELFRCEIPEAEPQLCHFLYLDHYLAGNFGTSLRWIQEAHRLWKELSDPDGSYYASYCFECEAKLFMQLDKFPEAAKSLENLLNAKDYVHQKDPQFAATVHDWMQECYTQMSRKAEDPQLAKSYGESAELQHALKCSLSSDDHQESAFTGIPKSHPIMMPKPFPIGSSLGLVQELADFEKYLTKLPAVIGDMFNGHCNRAQAAQKRGDWEAAISEFQMGREFLKFSKKMTDQETYDWLLTWVDLPLANLYHFHAMKFEKAVEIWKEMQDCMKHQMPLNDFLYQGYAYFTFLSAVEYEWACSHSSDGKYKIVQEHATRYHMDDKRAERELCFWLYFGHFCQTCSSLEQSLRWLREAERLDKLHSPDRMCSSDEYFCCDYDYLRCEAEVLMALHNYEEAVCKLESLLKTRHVRQGSPSLARETRRWLQDCYVKIYGASDAETIQQALECSLTIDNQPQEGIGDEVPSPTGCMMLVQTNHTCEPTCGHTHQLTQSKSGLEQHLRQLPGPVRLAFRKHSNLGLLGQDHADWEGAIFNFEWCRELLKFSRAVTDKKSFDWLLVWADLPLAQLYEFRKMHFKKALNKWMEIFCSLPQNVDEMIYMAIALNFYVQAGMYQCADKDYPDLKDTVVKNFGTWGMLSMQDYVGRLDDRNSELTLLAFLKKQHFDVGNLEKCLHFAQEARRVVFEQSLSVDEHDKKTNDKEKLKYVVEEAICYINLSRFKDARQVMDKYGEGIDGEGILKILEKECDQESVSYKVLLESLPSSPLQELRLESYVLEDNGRYEEAVKRHEQCLEIFGKLRNDSKGLDTIIDEGFELGLYGRCGDEFYDYLRIGELHKKMYYQTCVKTYLERLSSLSAAELEAPNAQDVKFLRAVECFEKCIELSLPLGNSGQAAHIDHHLVDLYAHFDIMYYAYIIHIYNEIGTKSSFPASSNSVPMMEQLHSKLCKEIVAYLYLPVTLEKFVQRASVQHANMLYTRESYIESYIITPLDNIPYKLPYIHMQEHYCRKARLLHIMGLYGQMEEKQKFEKGAQDLRWKAFVYAERERARATLYQLGPTRIRDVASHELRRFENDDMFALKAIQEDYAALFKNDAVFVMFSHTYDKEVFLIYVIDQDGKLSMTQTELKGRPKRSLQKRLNYLHLYFEESLEKRLKGYTDELMNEDLEFLYDMLMRPVADQLDKMEDEHKLIIVPSEILAQVPFSALRDRNRPPGLRYLIERHTIALTPSLRVQAKLCERLRELQNSSSVGLGSIVALGDPAYGENHVPLRASGDEVRHIASLFPSESVITLLAEDATAKNLLDWIEKPSHEPTFRQAIVHIGAHGVVSGQKEHEDHTMSVLHLACHGSSAGDDSNVVSRGKEHQVDDEQEEDVYDVEEYETDLTSSSVSPVQNRSQQECQGAIASCSNATLEGSRSDNKKPSSCDAYDLKAGDIIDSKIKWRAELVVLSACRTSQGKMTGEGVLSLARAFMIAGVPCVVASQWNVGDRATSDQMRLFYNSLRTGELDVASALRSSMLQMLKPNKDGKAPFHVRDWAPFVVWGVPTLRIPDSLQQKGLGHGKEIMVDQRSVPTLHPNTIREVQDATSIFQVGLWTGR